ncbi:MAG: hypothetical protein H0W59_10535 [Chloroflexia bacterium]|nr:hypothetical protein [Chloroflexia bacterium]
MTAQQSDVEDRGEEQERLVRDIGAELTEAFVGFVRGDLSFADLSFGVYDALGDLNVIASGEYELEEDDDLDDDYDAEQATEEQEELSQEPSGR